MTRVMAVGVAVVGCGRIGKMHAEIFAATPGARLAGVVDRRGQHRDWLTKVAGSDAVLYPDADAVFADDRVDAVCIATSSDSHIALIRSAAAAGKKIFCEKPVGFTAQAIADLYHALPPNTFVQVGFNRRFDPIFRALQQALTAGELGRVYTYHLTNRDPRRPPAGFVGSSGGILLDFNVHDFDMLAFLSGSAVREVFARGANLLRDEAMLAAGDLDTVMLSVILADGTLANIDCTRESGFGYDQRAEVLGERGGLRADNLHQTQPTRLQEEGLTHAGLRDNFMTRFRESYIAQATAFVAACCGDIATADVPGLPHAAAAVAAAQAGMQSLKSCKSEAVDQRFINRQGE